MENQQEQTKSVFDTITEQYQALRNFLPALEASHEGDISEDFFIELGKVRGDMKRALDYIDSLTKQHLMDNMSAPGVTEQKFGRWLVKKRRSPDTVVVEDEKLLQQTYPKAFVQTVDKKELGRALKYDDGTILGAHLAPGSIGLTVSFKGDE